MGRPHTPRLATRLIITTLGLLLPLYLILLAGYSAGLRDQRTNEMANSVVLGQMAASVIDGFRRDLNGTVLATSLALGESARPLDQANVGGYLDALAREYPTLRAFFVTDPQGRVIAAQAGTGVGADVSSRSYIASLQAGSESIWSGGLAGLQTGQTTIAHGRAIHASDGQVRGFVIAAFQPQGFIEQLPVALASDARLILIDEHGRMLFASEGTSLDELDDLSGEPAVRDALGGTTVRLDGVQTPFASGPQYGAMVPVGRSGWVVAYLRPVEALESALRERLIQQALATTAVMAAAAFLIAYLTRRLLRPLRTLVASAAAVARGERAQIAVSGDPDVRELAGAMDDMSRAVAEREEALRDETRLVDTLRSVGQTLAGELELEKLVQAVTDAGIEVTGAEFGAFSATLVDERSAEVVRLDDITGDERHSDPLPFNGLVQRPVRSYLAVPVVSRSGDVLGGLFFGHTAPGVFSARAERLATGIAAHAAIAIDNARLYRQAQDAVRARDHFLSIASHELRTPLATIKATAQVALRASARGVLNQERADRSWQTISNTTDHVARLAADLLDVAHLQNGSMSMVRSRIDVPALVKQIADAFAVQWVGQRELILELGAPSDVFVEGDPDRLEQVFSNLLENAAKYSPRATTVRLLCSLDDGGVQVAVVDEGIGLPADAAASLFQPFMRASNAVDRHINGLGLGLHIARQVVEAHGGRIWCTSAGEGLGSTFYVWLPLAGAVGAY